MCSKMKRQEYVWLQRIIVAFTLLIRGYAVMSAAICLEKDSEDLLNEFL